MTIWVLRLSPTEVTPMHIPDVLLDPKVAAVTGLVGAAGCCIACGRRSGSSASGRRC